MLRILLLVVTVASAARAEELTILLPFAGDVVAPGAAFPIGVVRTQGALVAVGAVDLTVSAGSVLVSPSPDPYVATARVHAPLAAGDLVITATAAGLSTQRRLRVDPSALGELRLTVEPKLLVKGQGQTATVRVEGVGRTPEIAASVGTVSALVADGPGRWRATYTPGPALYPEVAVITAARPWPDDGSPAFALASVALPQSAAIVLPGATRPKVQMTVEIAGTRFGPVPSDDVGRFEIPIVVPPGHGTGQGISVDRLGTKRVTAIDLRLPPTNRIGATAWPRTLLADGQSEAELAILVVDKTGGPGSETPIAKAKHGSLGPVRAMGEGRYRARYRAPTKAVDDVVEVRLKDGSRALVPIAVETGPPASMLVRAEPALVPAPSSVRARIVVDVIDAFGLPVTDALVDVDAAIGTTLVVPGDAARASRITYVPPTVRSAWSDPVRVRARSLAGTHAAQLAFVHGRVVVVDAWGRPVPRAIVTIDGARVSADDGGFVALEARSMTARVVGSALPAVLFVARGDDGAPHGWPVHPGVLRHEVAIELMEPVAVDVWAARLPSGDVEWRVDGAGDGPRAISVSAPGQPAQIVNARAGTLSVPASVPVTVTDVDSGVSSVVSP